MVRAIRVLLVATLLLASSAAWAQRVEGDRAKAEGVYAAEVPVNGQGEAERNAGFARALAQVLGKLSGDRGAAARPGVGQELRRAKDYVAGYDYRQDEGVGPTGAPSYRTTLVVNFDQSQVDSLASVLGLPVWPTPRPKPVLWLAIDDGSGPRLVGLAQANAARSTLNRAIERGYRLGLPTGNAAEQAAVGAIWRGDSAAVARASARYSPPMQLIGKLYRSKAGWKADWIFVDSGKVLSTWTSEEADARRALSGGADGAADALMRRYAKRGTAAGPPGNYRVTFTGITSSDDFIRLSGYLQRLAVVRRITPVRASPSGVEFELELISGLQGFKRMTEGDDVLEAQEGLEGQPPVYRLR
ncbi:MULTISPECIES: DUF2066 domain-containing protein [unclassified Lysobacter]|uniref:DUF2066 domain-containing protein n=1 Tax=unclassified Lysobacter TaxID=2635362 RepID=UPI0006F27A28|nr:hypothetical protein ASD69_20080 [Lysobacter sp. Root604]KRD34378.1 hypothetical protein ASE35_11770 [Lysobacter sp. Root916]KRD78675.1 hypothetical protein ASE43_19765 [Lysobacter sp. Root983]